MQKCEKVEGGMTTKSRFHMGRKKTHTETSEVGKNPNTGQPTDHTVQQLGV